jgi:hypothetical protein
MVRRWFEIGYSAVSAMTQVENARGQLQPPSKGKFFFQVTGDCYSEVKKPYAKLLFGR